MTKGQVRRKELGLSVKEIAQKLNLTEVYVCEILAGKFPQIKEKYLRQLAEILDMPQDEILRPE